MLTTLGTRPAAGDVVDRLLECHGRIRAFTGLARRLGEARQVSGEEVAEAASQVRRYFTVALPLHAEDEDQSIVPRLAGMDPALDEELEAMSREHWQHAEPVGRLIGLCAQLAAAPGKQPALAPALLEVSRDLSDLFAIHLAREEQTIFPAIRRLLAPRDLAAIELEIQRRRSDDSASRPAS